jgi:hypothetical protein
MERGGESNLVPASKDDVGCATAASSGVGRAGAGQSSEGGRSDSTGGLESLETTWIPEGNLRSAAATFSFVWLLHSIALRAGVAPVQRPRQVG